MRLPPASSSDRGCREPPRWQEVSVAPRTPLHPNRPEEPPGERRVRFKSRPDSPKSPDPGGATSRAGPPAAPRSLPSRDLRPPARTSKLEPATPGGAAMVGIAGVGLLLLSPAAPAPAPTPAP